MIEDKRTAECRDRIKQNRNILEALESGQMSVGNGQTLRGEGDRTVARIEDLKRLIAMDEGRLESIRRGGN